MIDEIPVRLRVAPAADNPPFPKPRTSWPTGAVILRTSRLPDGSMRHGVLLEVVDRWIVNEYLVTPGVVADDETINYCRTHRANVLTGCYSRLLTMPVQCVKVQGAWTGLGYFLRARGYRSGWAIVTADLARTLFSVADHWAESQQRPGVWSVALPGLGHSPGGEINKYRKFRDAPLVKITPVGNHALAWWGSTGKVVSGPDGDLRRPHPKSGPFVDVLAGTEALNGKPVRNLRHAADLYHVSVIDRAIDPLDRLRSEALAIHELYQRVMNDAAIWNVGLDLSTLVSTGGLETALMRAVEPLVTDHDG